MPQPKIQQQSTRLSNTARGLIVQRTFCHLPRSPLHQVVLSLSLSVYLSRSEYLWVDNCVGLISVFTELYTYTLCTFLSAEGVRIGHGAITLAAGDVKGKKS